MNNKAPGSSNAASYLYLEDEGKKHLNRLLKAVESEPWGITLLQLSWTAGPLTFIALQGGYLLGYGTTAPLSLFAYFAGYTLISGLIGIIISISHKSYTHFKKESAEEDYLYVIRELSNLIFLFTDFRLGQLSKNDRKMQAAGILLKNTHALPEAIAIAVFDLTQDSKLATLAKKIESFRRSALSNRVHDLTAKAHVRFNKKFKKLRNSHSDAAEYLKLRLDGHAPSLKEGVPRADGFLQRVFVAAETGDESLMTTRDAEEFLTLVYELINGRKIEVLNFQYTGRKKLQDAAKKLEKYRALFRLSKATLGYRIERLFSILIKEGLIEGEEEFDIFRKYEAIYLALTQSAKALITPQHQEISGDVSLKLFQTLKKGMLMHQQLQKNYRQASLYQKQLKQAVETWRGLSEHYKGEKSAFRYGRGKRGLRIIKKSVFLNNQEKFDCASQLRPLVERFIEHTSSRHATTQGLIKQFAIEVAMEVEPFVHLSHPLIQYGIESTNAINLGSFEQGISAQAKALWTVSMIKELKINLGRSAQKLVSVLVSEYGESLDDDALEFLSKKFALDKEKLKTNVMQSTRLERAISDESFVQIKKTNPLWAKAISRVPR